MERHALRRAVAFSTSSQRSDASPRNVGPNSAVTRGLPGLLERLARRAGERVEHERVAVLVRRVVEERAKLRAAQLRRGIGDRLGDRVQIELRRQRPARSR